MAGIIGRNINGYIADSIFDGNLVGYITGGIIGSNYDRNTLISRLNGAGAIDNESREAIPEDSLNYLNNGIVLDKISNVSITDRTLTYWLENSKYFYSYNIDQASFDEAIRASRVLGLLIGLSNSDNNIYKIEYDDENLIFNGEESNSFIGVVNTATLYNNVEYDIPYSNILELNETYENSYVTYILGATVATFDAWNGDTYSNSRVVFTSESEKINRLDYLLIQDEESTIYRDFYISTDSQNTVINDAIYSFNLIQHTNNYQPDYIERFNLYYEFILKNFDADSTLTITIKNIFTDEELNTEVETLLTAEEIQQLINRNEAYIAFEPSQRVEISFAGVANGERYVCNYIFNFEG